MSLTVQFYTMVAMTAAGAWLGIAIDTFSRLLKRSSRKHWIVFMNDVLFWVVQGLIVFYLLFSVNEGELRFYVIVALLCGFSAYQGLLRSIYLKWLEQVILLVKRIIRFFRNLFHAMFVKPVKLLLQLLLGLVMMLLHFLKTVIVVTGKVLFAPLRWTGMLLWKLVPKSFIRFFQEKAGILKGIKNTIKKWLEKIRS